MPLTTSHLRFPYSSRPSALAGVPSVESETENDARPAADLPHACMFKSKKKEDDAHIDLPGRRHTLFL